MKMSMYRVFFVILGGAQLPAGTPSENATDNDWVLVSPRAHSAPTSSLAQLVSSTALLQTPVVQAEGPKAHLAKPQAVGSVAPVDADKQLKDTLNFQNDPKRYGLFPWEDASY